MSLALKMSIPTLGMLACIYVFIRASTGNFLGATINQYYPCSQNIGSTFPCFEMYDLIIVAFALMFAFIFFGICSLILIRFSNITHYFFKPIPA